MRKALRLLATLQVILIITSLFIFNWKTTLIFTICFLITVYQLNKTR